MQNNFKKSEEYLYKPNLKYLILLKKLAHPAGG